MVERLPLSAAAIVRLGGVGVNGAQPAFRHLNSYSRRGRLGRYSNSRWTLHLCGSHLYSRSGHRPCGDKDVARDERSVAVILSLLL